MTRSPTREDIIAELRNDLWEHLYWAWTRHETAHRHYGAPSPGRRYWFWRIRKSLEEVKRIRKSLEEELAKPP